MSATSLHHPRHNHPGPHHQERVELAAAFRLAARFGWHEAVANHFSLAVSEDGAQFLMNPRWRYFSTLRASDLQLLDARDPSVMESPDAPDPTAWALHGAIHRRFASARCVLHCHSRYATVIASLADSTIAPIDQNTMRFYGRVAVDEGFGGMALGAEAERACALLAERPILMMGNHGILVTGETVAEAFDELYYLERACETLVIAYSTGRPLRVASPEVARRTRDQWRQGEGGFARAHLAEMMHILDTEEPDYRA